GAAGLNVLGAVGQTYAQQGTYSPQAEEPITATGAWRYRGPAPTKAVDVEKPAVQETPATGEPSSLTFPRFTDVTQGSQFPAPALDKSAVTARDNAMLRPRYTQQGLQPVGTRLRESQPTATSADSGPRLWRHKQMQQQQTRRPSAGRIDEAEGTKKQKGRL